MHSLYSQTIVIVYFIHKIRSIFMINYLWSSLMLISIICSFFNGKVNLTCEAILTGSKTSIDFLISIAGVMAVWTGILSIAQKSNVTNVINKILEPLISLLFPAIYKDETIKKSICLTLSANFLGLSNAATPFAISTINNIEKSNLNESTKYRSVSVFIILSVASVQLMPSLLMSLRQKYGSASPFEILPIIWIVSLSSSIIGLLALNLGDFFVYFISKILKHPNKNITKNHS